MSSNAIAITRNLNSERAPQFLSTSPASSVSSSSGLYIPVHRRRRSMSRTDESYSSSSSSSSISSRPSSRAESHVESESGLGHHQDHDTIRVYSREALLALAKSPLATMPKEIKDGLRETIPEIVMSRKQRKTIEFRARSQQQQQPQITSHQKEMNTSSEELARRHQQQQHSPRQEPRNRVLLQDPPSDPAQHQQSGQSRRQVRLHQHEREQHAAAAQPRANQQKRSIASSTGTSRSHDADAMNWRRTAGPPLITISAA